MKRCNIILFAGFLILCTNLFGQEESPIPKISKQLEAYLKAVPKEKLYVETDKDIYKPGETLWFNAWTENCNPDDSKIKSSELILTIYDDNGETIKQDKYKLEDGTAHGDFDLPEDLLKGTYYLSAYSESTKRPGDTFIKTFQVNPFYHDDVIVQIIPSKEVAVAGLETTFYILVNDLNGNPVEKQSMNYEILDGDNTVDKGKIKTDEKGRSTILFKMPDKSSGKPLILEISDRKETWIEKRVISSSLDQVDLVFYPEGGNVLPGVPVKIGFTAKNKWGQPINIEGQIRDNKGDLVSMVKSFVPGFGLFSLAADPEKQYHLELTSETGKGQIFLLPNASTEKTGLAVSRMDDQYIYLDVYAPQHIENYPCALTVTGCTGMSWAADLTVNKASRFKIPITNLPQGINQLSLFSKDGSLVAHRIVYIQKNRQVNVQINMSESILAPGETGEFKITLTDQNNNPVQGNISLSIRDKENTLPNEDALFSYLELNSKLKNTIPQEMNTPSSRIFDYMLIANEMKDFNWDKIMQYDSTGSENNSSISGTVIDNDGKPVPNAKVSLVQKRSIQFFSEVADDNGHFIIPGIDPDKKDEYGKA